MVTAFQCTQRYLQLDVGYQGTGHMVREISLPMRYE